MHFDDSTYRLIEIWRNLFELAILPIGLVIWRQVTARAKEYKTRLYERDQTIKDLEKTSVSKSTKILLLEQELRLRKNGMK